MSSVAQDLKNLGWLLFYVVQTTKSVVMGASYAFFTVLNLMFPFLRLVFSLVPGLLSCMGFLINLVIKLFHLGFTMILFVSLPILSIGGYIAGWILPTSIMQDFQGIFATVSAWCSYFTVYMISIIFILTGSLIIATEETIPNRNMFRPRTTVPLCALIAGLVIHYDKIHGNDWVAPVALFTGALWYCISLVYDDIAARERIQAARDREQAAMRWDPDGRDLSANNPPSSPNSRYLYPNLRERVPLKLKRNGKDTNKCYVIRPGKDVDTDREKNTSCGRGLEDRNGKGEGEGLLTDVYLESSCPICFDSFEADEIIRALSCKHTFHRHCIGEWLGKSSRCPICREPQTRFGQLVHALFE